MTKILHEVHLHGIDVRDLTFDGTSVNIGMAEEKGAIIYEATETSTALFKDDASQKNIYVSLDGCHVLKLARNTFSAFNITRVVLRGIN